MPALSAERIRLLEEIGIDWGEKRVTTPWDDRFQALVQYKSRFGNVNVPWQWKENVALAQWVNSQRKKYKDLLEGKRNNLSEEQINRLNSIGECTSLFCADVNARATKTRFPQIPKVSSGIQVEKAVTLKVSQLMKRVITAW